MWFSVWMCVGIAGELALRTALSCTSRSKICEVAGEDNRGEPEKPRPGDDGGSTNAWSFWVGQVEDCVVESFDPSRDIKGGLVVAEFEFDLVSDWDRESDFVLSVDFFTVAAFFFPNPKRLRFLLFLASSGWLAFSSAKSPARGVELFNRSSSAKMAWSYRPLGVMLAGSARLMTSDVDGSDWVMVECSGHLRSWDRGNEILFWKKNCLLVTVVLVIRLAWKQRQSMPRAQKGYGVG